MTGASRGQLLQYPVAQRVTDEARRLALLRDIGILDSAPEPSFDGLTRTAATLTGCPIALVSLLDEDRQWFKSATGLPVSETPLAHAFCAHAVRREGLLEVEDTHADPRFASNALVTGAPHIRFYAGHPLELDGVRFGTLCVIDTVPRSLSDTMRDALAGLASTATALVAARRTEQQLQAHQRRLADVALASGDWLWDTDVDHRVLWAVAHTAPHATRNILVEGTRLPDGLLRDGRGEILQPPVGFHSLLTRQAGIVRAIIEVAGAFGTHYLSFSALPRWDDAGHLAGFRGTTRDVSAAVAQERQRYERDMVLHLERDAARQAAKLRGDLVSRVSHELRTPLNAVLGFSQLLLHGSGDADTPEVYAKQINRAATHLLGLVNDMLGLARLESGREAFDLRPVATASVIGRCAELMASEASERGVQIAWTVTPGAEAVRADLRGLSQILLNLLSNALKWTPRGGEVSVMAQRTAHGRLALSVSDEGPGIAAELIPVLFQPFSQLPGGNQRGGTGLGLSISQQLATGMGGEISVVSAPGRGSCFTVTLDAAETGLLQAIDSDFSALDSGPPVAPGPQPLKVVYIEDDPVNAMVLDHMLAHLGNVAVQHADTARAGRELVASSRPDLILLDMNLPDGHGLQVIEALFEDMGAARIPVVALSADVLPESIELARAAGCADYLTKPVDLATLERLLAVYRQRIAPERAPDPSPGS